MNIRAKISDAETRVNHNISTFNDVRDFYPVEERLKRDIEIQDDSFLISSLTEKSLLLECKEKKHLVRAFTVLDFSKTNCYEKLKNFSTDEN